MLKLLKAFYENLTVFVRPRITRTYVNRLNFPAASCACWSRYLDKYALGQSAKESASNRTTGNQIPCRLGRDRGSQTLGCPQYGQGSHG